MALPVKLDTFVNYGLEFQKRYVPNLENTQVTGLSRRDTLFEITTAAGGAGSPRFTMATINRAKPVIVVVWSSESLRISCPPC